MPARGPRFDRRGGVITINVKDILIGACGLDGVVPPRYSPLLINTFDSMSQPTSLNQIPFLSIVVPEEAQRIIRHTAVEDFTSPEWRRLLRSLENPASLAVPLPFTLLPMQVLISSSSNFTMMCPRLMRISIATDIPTDEVHGE